MRCPNCKKECGNETWGGYCFECTDDEGYVKGRTKFITETERLEFVVKNKILICQTQEPVVFYLTDEGGQIISPGFKNFREAIDDAMEHTK